MILVHCVLLFANCCAGTYPSFGHLHYYYLLPIVVMLW